MSAARERGALLLSDLDILHHGVKLSLADERSHLAARIEAVADNERPRPWRRTARETTGTPSCDDDAAGGRAALAGCAEAAPQASLDGEIEVRRHP